jgi:hypothetical protein
MTHEIKRNQHRISQQKLRARKAAEGWMRLDVYLSPDLWQKLKPHLAQYGSGKHPGYSLVKMLEDIRFVDVNGDD